ncbi:glucose 1-dehydrogenase [Glaciihabitans sp. UYNi722]|uniref:SDR family NAD(P)-dependent oxidoreductase n=1 Tax=Glaciihabitans sp. UYNi722 TaxID=3156344 RepID=UPI003396E8F0
MTDSLFDLGGTVALVTGAGRGLGRAIALELAAAGSDVALGLRDPAHDGGLTAEIAALGRRALALPMDVRDLEQSRAAIDRTVAELGALDILVNNAGGGIVAPAIDVSEDDFDAVWSFNTRATFFISQHAARHMRSVGSGAIINMASQAGLVALPGESTYAISKAAIIHMTKALAVEWGEFGIRVNAVAPTFIETDGTSAALSDPAFRADTIDRIAALHRIGAPREVSGAVVFLASRAASLITGTTLPIDGGWTAR